jgi:D-beta-D-heptose 7-phosphate kinase / D-beta-D-heptose 1-phosphate adenosyltransferase
LTDAMAEPRSARDRVLSLEALLARLRTHRESGERIVFTNGCFDLLHAGHAVILEQAAHHGDRLVVGLNSDASVRRLKGAGRPLIEQEARALLLASLRAVEYVVMFDQDTPAALIEAILPDVLIKGADYRRDQVVGRDTVEAAGGRVVTLPLVPGFSTSELARRLRAAP